MPIVTRNKTLCRAFLWAAVLAAGASTVGVSAAEELGSNIGDVDHPLWYSAPSEETLKLAEIDDLSSTVVSDGPYGEEGVLASSIEITDGQRKKIAEGDFTVAISMGWLGDDWATQQLLGLRGTFEDLGIEVVATTNANWQDSKQISDLEAIAALEPDLVVSIPLNAETTASAFQALAKAGTKVVFIDQPASGMKPGEDYVSTISSDNLALGMYLADLLARELDGEGEVGAMYFANDFYVTNLRYIGFIARLMVKHPGLELVTTAGHDNPDKGQQVAQAMLARNPGLDGLYASWSIPAMGAVTAAKISGRRPESFPIVCENFDQIVAGNMAEDGFIAGISSQRPYDQGVAEAKIGALSLIGAETPNYVVVPPVKVYRDILPEAYRTVYRKPLPDEMAADLGNE